MVIYQSSEISLTSFICVAVQQLYFIHMMFACTCNIFPMFNFYMVCLTKGNFLAYVLIYLVLHKHGFPRPKYRDKLRF